MYCLTDVRSSARPAAVRPLTRVAVFTDSDFDNVNGVTTTLNAVLRHAPPDVSLRIYTADVMGSDGRDYFSVPSFGLGLPWYRETKVYWPRLQKFADALAADEIDVVHITTPGPMGLAGRYLAGRLSLPLTGSYHALLGQYVEALSGSARLGHGMERYMRWLYGACESILVPTHTVAGYLAHQGYPRDRLAIWSRGVDSEVFTPQRRSLRLRDRWNVDDRRPVVMYAGRLSREKGLGLMPDIQRRLYAERIGHRLVFVGDGPMSAELRTRCPDAAFLGRVPHDTVASAMASADVFLFPSATDALGNVVLEAQASGLPVVVSDAGGPQEMVLPGKTGLVAPAGDARAFSDQVIRLLRYVGERRTMSQRARAHALGFSWPESLAPLIRAWQMAGRNRRAAADSSETAVAMERSA